MPDKYVCKLCGCELFDYEKFCHKCGTRRSFEDEGICKNCGTVLIDGAAFCYECGKPINAEEKSPLSCAVPSDSRLENVMYCQECGFELDNNAEICTVCKTPVPSKQDEVCPDPQAAVQLEDEASMLNGNDSLVCLFCGTPTEKDAAFCTACGNDPRIPKKTTPAAITSSNEKHKGTKTVISFILCLILFLSSFLPIASTEFIISSTDKTDVNFSLLDEAILFIDSVGNKKYNEKLYKEYDEKYSKLVYKLSINGGKITEETERLYSEIMKLGIRLEVSSDSYKSDIKTVASFIISSTHILSSLTLLIISFIKLVSLLKKKALRRSFNKLFAALSSLCAFLPILSFITFKLAYQRAFKSDFSKISLGAGVLVPVIAAITLLLLIRTKTGKPIFEKGRRAVLRTVSAILCIVAITASALPVITVEITKTPENVTPDLIKPESNSNKPVFVHLDTAVLPYIPADIPYDNTFGPNITITPSSQLDSLARSIYHSANSSFKNGLNNSLVSQYLTLSYEYSNGSKFVSNAMPILSLLSAMFSGALLFIILLSYALDISTPRIIMMITRILCILIPILLLISVLIFTSVITKAEATKYFYLSLVIPSYGIIVTVVASVMASLMSVSNKKAKKNEHITTYYSPV